MDNHTSKVTIPANLPTLQSKLKMEDGFIQTVGVAMFPWNISFYWLHLQGKSNLRLCESQANIRAFGLGVVSLVFGSSTGLCNLSVISRLDNIINCNHHHFVGGPWLNDMR